MLFLREEGATATPPPGAVLPRAVSEEGVDAPAVAREALRAAREQFLASAFGEAAVTLQRAGSRATEGLLREDRALAVELQLWAGACAALASDGAGARQAFLRALAYQPEATLPPGVFPPEVERAFDEVRRGVVLAGATARTVRTVPAGARVEVDGRPEGRTPVTLRLTPGVHHLRLERTGYRRWVGPLTVEGAAMGDVEVVLAEATVDELRAQLGRPEGLHELPEGAVLARARGVFHVDAVVLARRDGGSTRWPARTSTPAWPWVVGGAAVAAGVGVGLYFLLRPAETFNIVAPAQ
ncbi:MAG: PEGA domain-containing protein [Polyangiales bacterium]